MTKQGLQEVYPDLLPLTHSFQCRKPINGLRYVCHTLDTLALFSENLCHTCTNFILEKNAFSKCPLLFLAISLNCLPPRMAGLVIPCKWFYLSLTEIMCVILFTSDRKRLPTLQTKMLIIEKENKFQRNNKIYIYTYLYIYIYIYIYIYHI